MNRKSSARKAQAFRVKDPVFGSHPLFVFNCNQHALKRILKKHAGVDFDVEGMEEHLGLQEKLKIDPFTDKPRIFIWLRTFDGTPKDIGSLVHELEHLCLRICEHLQIPVHGEEDGDESGEHTDEPMAYMMDFYTREVLSRLLK